MSPAHERMLKYFSYEHLPLELQKISGPLCELAFMLADRLEASSDPAEVTAGLRKLLEAKDCFVRAKL